jgi:uncharacterized RmlC-like cupin family protein
VIGFDQEVVKHMANESITQQSGVVVVHTPAEIMSRQGLPYFMGISEQTAGAKSLSMNLIIIPPGGRAEPHVHVGHETAIYILEGRVDTRYGPGLRESVIGEAGDFIFIAAEVPHEPINLSTTHAAKAIVARNDANEQESGVPYDPATDTTR